MASTQDQISPITAECKIHGGYWHMPVLSVAADTVTVRWQSFSGRVLADGTIEQVTRTLPRVTRDELRRVENGAVV